MDIFSPHTLFQNKITQDLAGSASSYHLRLYLTDPRTNKITSAVVDDPLYRVETGNYDYRVVLRCRQLARAKFAKARNDVMVKLELLEAKQVQDTVFQLQRLVANLQRLHDDQIEILKSFQGHFPIEIELHRVSGVVPTANLNDNEDDDDEVDDGDDDVDPLDDNANIFEPNPLENGEPATKHDELLLDLG